MLNPEIGMSKQKKEGIRGINYLKGFKPEGLGNEEVGELRHLQNGELLRYCIMDNKDGYSDELIIQELIRREMAENDKDAIRIINEQKKKK